ncbi:nucleotidyltransferase domain-containing protein [bacterium]|nr:nucleotidyltransferase domain-containing protein [bacterium]MBU1752917.1 nucleotidyltransferase domain-containing protein [bacterium]
MVEESIIKDIERFAHALEKEGVDVNKIILYGSHREGRARIDSDIDIAVVSRDFGKDPTEEGMNLFRVACEIDPRMEPVPISLESYENDTWVPLIYDIRQKGMEVYTGTLSSLKM